MEVPGEKPFHVLLGIISYPWFRFQLSHQDVMEREQEYGGMVSLAETLLQQGIGLYCCRVCEANLQRNPLEYTNSVEKPSVLSCMALKEGRFSGKASWGTDRNEQQCHCYMFMFSLKSRTDLRQQIKWTTSVFVILSPGGRSPWMGDLLQNHSPVWF